MRVNVFFIINKLIFNDLYIVFIVSGLIFHAYLLINISHA
ncbi:hypothetical protein JN11_02028 [Mucilaginibacter frigoritolerans]|jgi:hypothetical protein|uniref:Uncharacterized protein n=1 Tax=Mucilaginibacter frigoritolerans TaxID=652788 RepID=A0A562U5B1_9SPHI|nr:hypothetical protein JN11_02028 [Mucilaginibacter frigoritolerans]